jgi:polar amino acid transport system substrate-binding protein
MEIMLNLKNMAAIVLLLLIAIEGFVEKAKAQDQIDFVIMEQMPYGAINQNNQIEGYLAEIAHLLLENAGFKNEIRIIPLKRLIVEGKAREFDCTIVADTPLAKSFLQLIAPTGLKLTGGILPRQDVVISRYEDLKGKRIGVPLGVSTSPKFDQDTTLTKLPAADYSGAVRMLERGRIDAIYGSFQSLAYDAILLGHEPAKLFGEGLPLTALELQLACVPDKMENSSIEKLEQALEKLVETGVVARIGSRYNASSEPNASD